MEHPLKQFVNCPKCGSLRFIENNFKSKKCEDCHFVYYFNPSAASVAVILNEQNQVLICRRANEPAKGTLDLPGGFVDMYETGEEAVAREVKEETGLDVVHAQYLLSLPNLYVYSGFEVQTLDLFYLCNVKNCNQLVAQDDIDKSQFVDIEKLVVEDFGLASIRRGIKWIKEHSERIKQTSMNN